MMLRNFYCVCLIVLQDKRNVADGSSVVSWQHEMYLILTAKRKAVE